MFLNCKVLNINFLFYWRQVYSTLTQLSGDQAVVKAQGHIHYKWCQSERAERLHSPQQNWFLNSHVFVVLYLKKPGICKFWIEYLLRMVCKAQDPSNQLQGLNNCSIWKWHVKIRPTFYILNVLIWERGNMYLVKGILSAYTNHLTIYFRDELFTLCAREHFKMFSIL